MINTNWYSIQALTLPATAIALLITFFIVWLILRLQFSKKWSEAYSDAAFTFILVWKFSLLVTDFKSVVAQPISLLYFNGGTVGVFLGAIAASLQVWRKRRQLSLQGYHHIMAYSWAIILTQSIYQWLVVLFNDNSTTSEVTTLMVLSVLTIFILWKMQGVKRGLILYTAGVIIVAFFQPLGIEQTAVGMSLLLLCLGIVLEQGDRIKVGG
ncbi:hypothetical protein AABM34_03565 [Lysinibacillus fusiformis]